MVTPAELKELVADFSDEELIERIRGGTYTDVANNIMREELAARGVDYESTHGKQEKTAVQLPKKTKSPLKVFLRLMLKGLAFPWNAFLGKEAPWKVLLIGGVIVFAANRLLVEALVHLGVSRPFPSYGFAAGYTAGAMNAVIVIWFAISLWRTASRNLSTALEVALRLIAVFFFINATWGTMGAIQSFHDLVPDTRPSIMDLNPDR